MNRNTIKLGLAGLLLASAVFAAEKQPMNVLMIAIDDMNNWVGCMGNDSQARTPNIDRLARQGMLFDNAYCVVPSCNPSRAALMTGQRPETTGQFGNDGNFRDRPGGMERITMPQHFRQHGYEAVAAGKIYHNPRGEGSLPDPVSDPLSWNKQWVGQHGTGGHDGYLNDEGYAKWHDGRFKQYLGKFGVWGPCPELKESTGDWQAAGYIADYLQMKHDKPFFAACGIFRPHEPLLAPQKYFDMFPLDQIKLPNIPEDDFDDIPRIAHKNFSTDFFIEGVKGMGEWKKRCRPISPAWLLPTIAWVAFLMRSRKVPTATTRSWYSGPTMAGNSDTRTGVKNFRSGGRGTTRC